MNMLYCAAISAHWLAFWIIHTESQYPTFILHRFFEFNLAHQACVSTKRRGNYQPAVVCRLLRLLLLRLSRFSGGPATAENALTSCKQGLINNFLFFYFILSVCFWFPICSSAAFGTSAKSLLKRKLEKVWWQEVLGWGVQTPTWVPFCFLSPHPKSQQ